MPPSDLSAWSLSAQPAVGLPLAGAALDLAAATWLTTISLGAGHALLRRFGVVAEGALATIAFSLGLGFGILGLSFLVLGAIGFLAPIPAFFLLGGFTGVALLEAKRVSGALIARPEEPWQSPERRGEGEIATGSALAMTKAMQVVLAITAILTLTGALAPPLAWDALVYHLTGPKRYIEAGVIVEGIDIPHLYFPSLVEQLFTAAMLVRGDVAAQVMHFALAATAVLAVFAFLDRREGRRAAWLGAALFATAPSLVSLARIPYVEWGLIAFGFLSFWALREALDRHVAQAPSPAGVASSSWLVLSGTFAGLALGTKYTAAFLILGLAIALVWETRRLRSLALWCGAAGVAAAPWFLRNAVLTGNPVYPFVFGGWSWDSWKAEWFSRAGTGLWNEPWRLLIAPWDLTVLSGEGGGAYDVDMGPLFLALAPVMLTLRQAQGKHLAAWGRAALIIVAVGYIAWLFGAAQSSLLLQGRLLLPILPFLACLMATALCRPELKFARVLHAAVLISLILAVAGYAFRWAADPPLPYLLRTETRAVYLERHLGDHYRAIDFRNRQDGRTLFLWEPRSYYCTGECQPDALLFNWRYLLHRHGTAEGAVASMKSDGYTHLLVYGGGLRFFSQGPRSEVEPGHIGLLMELESRYLERLYGPSLREALEADVGAGYAVYRLR